MSANQLIPINGLGVRTQVKICWDMCIQCMLQSTIVMSIMCWRHGMNVSHESTGNFEDFKFDRDCNEAFVHLIMIHYHSMCSSDYELAVW